MTFDLFLSILCLCLLGSCLVRIGWDLGGVLLGKE